jgi:hypothetical protein
MHRIKEGEIEKKKRKGEIGGETIPTEGNEEEAKKQMMGWGEREKKLATDYCMLYVYGFVCAYGK